MKASLFIYLAKTLCMKFVNEFMTLLPEQMHMPRLNTFRQPFLYRKLFVQQPLLAAQRNYFGSLGTAQQYTWNPLH